MLGSCHNSMKFYKWKQINCTLFQTKLILCSFFIFLEKALEFLNFWTGLILVSYKPVSYKKNVYTETGLPGMYGMQEPIFQAIPWLFSNRSVDVSSTKAKLFG